jgi:hypothetical protein
MTAETETTLNIGAKTGKLCALSGFQILSKLDSIFYPYAD